MWASLHSKPYLTLNLQGDREDRIKIQSKKEADKKRMEEEQLADELMVEAATMARMGESCAPPPFYPIRGCVFGVPCHDSPEDSKPRAARAQG